MKPTRDVCCQLLQKCFHRQNTTHHLNFLPLRILHSVLQDSHLCIRATHLSNWIQHLPAKAHTHTLPFVTVPNIVWIPSSTCPQASTLLGVTQELTAQFTGGTPARLKTHVTRPACVSDSNHRVRWMPLSLALRHSPLAWAYLGHAPYLKL